MSSNVECEIAVCDGYTGMFHDCYSIYIFMNMLANWTEVLFACISRRADNECNKSMEK